MNFSQLCWWLSSVCCRYYRLFFVSPLSGAERRFLTSIADGSINYMSLPGRRDTARSIGKKLQTDSLSRAVIKAYDLGFIEWKLPDRFKGPFMVCQRQDSNGTRSVHIKYRQKMLVLDEQMLTLLHMCAYSDQPLDDFGTLWSVDHDKAMDKLANTCNDFGVSNYIQLCVLAHVQRLICK